MRIAIFKCSKCQDIFIYLKWPSVVSLRGCHNHQFHVNLSKCSENRSVAPFQNVLHRLFFHFADICPKRILNFLVKFLKLASSFEALLELGAGLGNRIIFASNGKFIRKNII